MAASRNQMLQARRRRLSRRRLLGKCRSCGKVLGPKCKLCGVVHSCFLCGYKQALKAQAKAMADEWDRRAAAYALGPLPAGGKVAFSGLKMQIGGAGILYP